MGSGQSQECSVKLNEQKSIASRKKTEDCNILLTENCFQDNVKQVHHLVPQTMEQKVQMDNALQKESESEDSEKFIVFESQPTYSPMERKLHFKQQIKQINQFQSPKKNKSASPSKRKQKMSEILIQNDPILNLKYNYQQILYH